jgi:hypothetical protein
MRFFRSLTLRRLVFALCLVAFCTSISLARRRLYRYNIATLSGVDLNGTADDLLGGKAPVKVYKDPISGIVLQLGQGLVTNDFGFNRLFGDRGLTIVDPTTGNTVTATSDLEVITFRQLRLRNGLGFDWWAAELRVFDPAAN